MSNANEPAYPVAYEYSEKYNSDCINQPGLTKRELIAAMAMQGILSGLADDPKNKYAVNDGYLNMGLIAKESVDCADYLLKQLSNE